MRPLERVRRPEYTGANRCWPCTIVNVALVALVAGVLAVAVPLAGIAVAAVGVAAVATRGYVVPYTPRFAPQLVAALPGGEQLFDHSADPPGPADGDASGLGDEGANGERALQALVDAGVLTGAENLELAADFRTDWRARMNELDQDSLTDACVDAAPAIEHATLDEDGDQTWLIVSHGDRSAASETWLTPAVAVADVAAIRALTDRGIDDATAADAAAALRLFLDECPQCGGDVVETSDDGCCGFGPSGPDRALACEDCGQRVKTLD